MEKLVEFVLLPLLAAGLIGFYGSAIFQPKLFAMLIKPALASFAAIFALATAFSFGCIAGMLAVTPALDGLQTAARKSATDSVLALAIQGLWVAGVAALLMILALAIIPIANRQLEEEAKASSQNHGKD